ncbi:uncharacterized protein LOC131690373 [Topomyia yanbarensis]|uniref:uncharacterized protein LOC131690373 n=1 Tax=Topomyia yanbarensis TaxID=2498891 RepID=UPI00273A9826|nr:uncharacterized protein LOC131690373 [Topomyia yanbarensis]
MDIFQNQCTESLGFDSMLASNPINSPLQSTDSSTQLTFSSCSYFTTIPSTNSTVYTGETNSPSVHSSVAVCTGSMGGSSGPNDVVLPSIFVKVPKQINQQYQQQNQSRSNAAEIKSEDKSEPIKRELGDLRALEKGTAMVQLPSVAERYLTDDRQERQEEPELSVHCCEFCPFVTIEEQVFREHIHSKHPTRNRENVELMNCPACGNKFRKRNSLEVHLVDDHMMSRSEMRILVERRFPQSEPLESLAVNAVQQENVALIPSSLPSAVPDQNKSRIYIKNVQLLKKPDVIEQENVQHAQEQQAEQQQSRKIFIRNVSLLQNASFVQNVDNVFQNPSGLHESKYSFVVPAPSPNSQSPPISISEANNTTPQRSKIFIRNVDILRNPLLPITPPSIVSTCEMSRTSSSESLYTTPPPPVISPATSVTSIGGNSMGCSGLNMVIIPTPICSSNSSTPPMISTPPAITVASAESMLSMPTRKSKIFIKNISVLKQPTIHLKSVDELNLMTIDQLQLQNLLPTTANSAQNLENGDLSRDDETQPMDEDDFGSILEEPPSDMDVFSETGNQYHELQSCNSICGSMPADQQSYQPEFNSDFIIIQPESSTENISYEGSAEHLRMPTQTTDLIEHQQLPLPPAEPPESQYHPTDEDILFVCAEEIINLDPPIPQEKAPLEQTTESFSHTATQQPPQQQGRIYVSDNLMEHHQPVVPLSPSSQPSSCLSGTGISSAITPLSKIEQIHGDVTPASCQLESPVAQASTASHHDMAKRERTRSRGRPKGAKQTGITKLKKLYTNLTPLEEGYKCDLVDCGARFRQPDTLVYHKRCHIQPNELANSDGIRCPECGSQEFRNWNTLHTHLWREHSIDMELYSCHLCNFKTPVLCRLNNTHMKIHSDEKNFICAVCDKGFKNNKQLRNHRRSHREQPQIQQAKERQEEQRHQICKQPSQPVNCVKCGLKFSNPKILKAHVESNHVLDGDHCVSGEGRMKCSICGMVFKTRYLLKSHVAKHSDEKKFKCSDCDYSTNDHNAIRRHKMRHNTEGHMYRCSYCDYTSIQSTTYRKHLERMHADVASNLLYKCSRCTFVSISELKYHLHRAKHDANEDITEEGLETSTNGTMDPADRSMEEEEQERHCESVNSDVVIVEKDQSEPPLDAFSLIPLQHTDPQDHQFPLQPMIRTAGFANNLSKVDNFYGYSNPTLDSSSHHYQQQGALQGSSQQEIQMLQGDIIPSSSTTSSSGADSHQHEYLGDSLLHGMVPLSYGEDALGS